MRNIITPILNCYSNQRKVDELTKEVKKQRWLKNRRGKKVKKMYKEIQHLKRKLFITEIRLNNLTDKVDLKSLNN